MKTSIAFAIMFSFACAAETAPAPPALRHYEFRADQLPPPFATQSAGNPPRVTAPPPGARLVLPPGFKISVFADNLDDPRRMLLAPNGDVLLAEPGAGKITILRDANHDGVAEQRFTFAKNLDGQYELPFHDDFLHIGDEDAVVR